LSEVEDLISQANKTAINFGKFANDDIKSDKMQVKNRHKTMRTKRGLVKQALTAQGRDYQSTVVYHTNNQLLKRVIMRTKALGWHQSHDPRIQLCDVFFCDGVQDPNSENINM
jgi:hypothetical protein